MNKFLEQGINGKLLVLCYSLFNVTPQLRKHNIMHLSLASPRGGGGDPRLMWGNVGLYGDFIKNLSPSGGGNVGT